MNGAAPRRSPPPAVEVIARGSTGTVELAFRRPGDGAGFRRMVAIKRLHESLREDESARRMFLREARVTGELRHPNVVGVLDVGEDPGGPYLVMDYVFGLSLRELRALLAERGVALPLQVALRIAADVARGLRAAHELVDARGEPLGLIHRDVSPNNVLVGFDGVVRLVDFGLARALEDGRTGELLRGTSGYVAPEQLRFEPIDARADLFALGVLLVELVTGERLYGDPDVRRAARRILREPVPDLRRWLPEIPEGVAALAASLLAKDPGARPTGAAEVERALEREVREQVVRDGAEELWPFLEAHLGDEVEARRERLAALWRRFEGSEARAAGEGPAPVDGAPRAAAPEAPTSAAAETTDRLRAVAPPRRRGVRLAAAIGLVGMLGAALAWLALRPAVGTRGEGGERGMPSEARSAIPAPAEDPPPAEPASEARAGEAPANGVGASEEPPDAPTAAALARSETGAAGSEDAPATPPDAGAAREAPRERRATT
ncbi:MAG TPA: serine/threonine-protein kinase, partial [Polyangiaceae bacterium LLY-WYZ-15_(1-7)]|nr:serine/threonine-protein kinase [Polyangiaceae bacterium LLY-WYZ-15_(1-7)]